MNDTHIKHPSAPRSRRGVSSGGVLKTTVAVLTTVTALLTALASFIQVSHVAGLSFAVESETPSPTPTLSASPSPSLSPSASPSHSPSASPSPTASPTGSVSARLCVPTNLGTTTITVTSFEPTWNDFRFIIGIPFGGSSLRLSQDTRTVRIGVTVQNRGFTALSLSEQNWRLFDGTSYDFASPPPSPSPAYVSQSIPVTRSYSGYLVFVNVPRSITALSFEAKFGGQSTIYKLPETMTTC